MSGCYEHRSPRHDSGREVGKKVVIKPQPIAEPPPVLSPKPGQSTSMQLHDDPAKP
jgi:hypothetical protein